MGCSAVRPTQGSSRGQSRFYPQHPSRCTRSARYCSSCGGCSAGYQPAFIGGVVDPHGPLLDRRAAEYASFGVGLQDQSLLNRRVHEALRRLRIDQHRHQHQASAARSRRRWPGRQPASQPSGNHAFPSGRPRHRLRLERRWCWYAPASLGAGRQLRPAHCHLAPGAERIEGYAGQSKG